MEQFEDKIQDVGNSILLTLEDLADAVNRVLSARGFPGHTLNSYRYFVGDGVAMLIRRALPVDRRHDDIIRACLDAFLRDYGRNWDTKTKPYKGIPELLDSLTARKINVKEVLPAFALQRSGFYFAQVNIAQGKNSQAFEE